MLDRSHRIGCSSGHVFHQIGSSSSYFKQELRIKYIEPEEHISYTSALNTYAAELIEVKVTSKTTLTLHQHTICQILPAALPPLAQESRTATGKLIHFLSKLEPFKTCKSLDLSDYNYSQVDNKLLNVIGIKFPALEICKLSWDNTNEREILLESHLIKECKHLQYLELTAYNVELQLDAADCYPCYNSTTKNVLIDLGKDIEKRSEAIKQQLLEAGLQQSPLIR